MKLVSFFLCWSVMIPALLEAQTSSASRPNVIVILADDLGYGDLGCYGNTYMRTPNIDRLAKDGLRFTQAYAGAPVCSPSRAALLTGRSPAELKVTQYEEGVRGDTSSSLLPAPFEKHLPYGIKTIAHHFKENGYVTGMIGKWHLGKDDKDQPSQFGFDYERVAKNAIFYYNFSLLNNNKEVFRSAENENLTDRLTLEAEEFIKKNTGRPFFLYLAHFAPHLLLQPEPQKLPHYYFTWKDKSQGRFDPQYAATIETLDDGVGSVIKLLDSLQILSNTLVIFTSDNGGLTAREFGLRPTDNSPLREGKGHLYEGGIRIPFIMMWKGRMNGGETNDTPIIQTDLSATLQHLLGFRSPEKNNGFESVLSANKPSVKTFFWHYPHFSNQGGRPSSAIRANDYKLIYHYESGKKELYNLKNDVSEANDLAAQQPDRVDSLFDTLQHWLSETAANKPIQKNR